MVSHTKRIAQITGSFGWVIVVLVLQGCNTTNVLASRDDPDLPRNLNVFYYASEVHLSWELGFGWDGEPFRIWGRRVSDADYFFIAEVTSCADGRCNYSDANVASGVTYVYYVSAVGLSGVETASDEAIEVYVPHPIPPLTPQNPDVVPLDGALFLVWSDASRQAEDFSFYRVYLQREDGSTLLLGETDSEGFLDHLVENGSTYGYFISAVDDQGHESEGSGLAEGTPRPDFHGELIYAFGDRSDLAGFRFQDSKTTDPIVAGSDASRDFRVEVDAEGWWLVPAEGVQIATETFFTTALRCGAGADAGCIDVRWAPDSGYGSQAALLSPEYAYVLRVPAGDGGWRYGLIRVSHLGFAQDGAIAIFDWAFQLQADNPSLMIRLG